MSEPEAISACEEDEDDEEEDEAEEEEDEDEEEEEEEEEEEVQAEEKPCSVIGKRKRRRVVVSVSAASSGDGSSSARDEESVQKGEANVQKSGHQEEISSARQEASAENSGLMLRPTSTHAEGLSARDKGHGEKSVVRSRDSAAPEVDSIPSAPWIIDIVSTLHKAPDLIRRELCAHPSPDVFARDLRKVQSAALALVTCTNAAIAWAHAQATLQTFTLKRELVTAEKEQKAMQEKCTATRSELEKQTADFRRKEVAHKALHDVQRSAFVTKQQEFATAKKELDKMQAQYSETKSQLEKQRADFQRKEKSINDSHGLQQQALLTEKQFLQRQLEEEKDKSICSICHEKPRDTIILPCLHFQYCFGCLLRHREVNSNTCPSCRGPIQGLNMSSYLAGQ
ncbi:hypothetical protein L7F22_049666 [Adiantum nelumboides]|nr:hypothetical protein [Adiantum nelumboides]